ncbi:MAG: AraC family transcriptional regulator [Treponema sp.]|jgi:AraC-like DNA-binding protein|nr:AraC family transcriptional regulator [Treponema sp.]
MGDFGEETASFLHYLPFSEEDEKLGMICTTAGTITVPPGVAYPPHRNRHPAPFRSVARGRILPIFQIVYITEGEGSFWADGREYAVKPGSVMLVLPGVRHRYKPLLETGWHEYWVGFMGDYFTRMLREGFLSRDKVFFNPGLQNYIVSRFNLVFDEIRMQRPLYQFKACTEILALIADILTRERRIGQPGYYQKVVEKAKYIMEKNLENTLSLPDISDELGISSSRFTEIFKTSTSMTPYQYYIQIKIHKAEEFLEKEDITVKEVALRLGFEDQYYFSRLFKRKTGIAPSRWKEYLRPRENAD